MAISFEESRKAAMASISENVAIRKRIVVPGTDNIDIETEVASVEGEFSPVYTAATETWIRADNYSYPYYSEFSDDRVSTISQNKTISLDPGQINISQEDKAQYIPFEMQRYYDGIDLSKAVLRIYFVNKEGNGGFSQPVNVQYSETKIRFGWLVDQNVTAVAGRVSFEIHANGTNSRNEPYTWKTRPSHDVNILESLSYEALANPGESWITSFFEDIDSRIETAQEAATEATGAVAQVKEYANQASAAAQEASFIIENAKSELETTIDTAIDEKITSVLDTYYTKEESDAITGAISDEVTDIKRQIENMDGLADFSVEYDGRTMTFYNGESVMKEISINSDPSEEWTTAYTAEVDEKIGSAMDELDQEISSVKGDLDALSKDVAGLPETLASDYYTKTVSDDRFATKNATDTNKQNIDSLGKKVIELEEVMSSVDTSPRLTYDMDYNTDGTYTLKLYQIINEGDSENEVRQVKAQVVIQGGSGGGGTSSVLKIKYLPDLTPSPYRVRKGNKVRIYFEFEGTDPGGDTVLEANASWKINGMVVANDTVVAGRNFFDVTDKLDATSSEQKVLLTVTDNNGGFATKEWRIELIDIRIDSNFDDTKHQPIGPVSFDYTPHGNVSKEIHFILDGDEFKTVTTTSSGVANPVPVVIPEQEHGSHLLEAYITARLTSNPEDEGIESDHIFRDIMWVDPTSDVPVISCRQQKFTAMQYSQTEIKFAVYDPNTETPTVVIKEDGVVLKTMTMDGSVDTYSYKSNTPGEHILTITCGETVKTLVATIKEVNIDISPVTLGLVFDFDPVGRSNNSVDRIWSDGDISMEVLPGFDWTNGGYQIDENGDQYFCIKAGTSALINYHLFADDAKANGKEFKIIFKTTNVQDADATFLSCVDGTTDANRIGIEMKVHEASIYGQVNKLTLPYSEDDIIEFEFNISKDNEPIPMVMCYEDGVSTRPMVYDSSYEFTQNHETRKYISLGSEYCDLHIYRLKVFNRSLDAKEILTNFITDARNADEMVARYNRNQIYDNNQNLDPDVLAKKCPWLRVYKLSAPYFTNKKSNKIPGTTIQQIYKDGDPVLDNWTCYDCSHSGQGTSSDHYGAAGRNIDFIMNNSQIEGVKPYFIMGDGSRSTNVTLTRTSVPVAYLNFKANIASSNNMTNAMLANRYNQFNPYKRQFIRIAELSDAYSDEEIESMTEEERASALANLQEIMDTEKEYIKDTMEFHNAVVFIRETDEDLATHREFADTAWHFYAIGNIGDSKKTDHSRLTDLDDKYECCVEIMDVELPLSDWPIDTMYNAMGYKEDEVTHERVYIWAKNENLGILYERTGAFIKTQDTKVVEGKCYYRATKADATIDDYRPVSYITGTEEEVKEKLKTLYEFDGTYELTSDTTVDLNKTYYVDILEHDDFSEDFTYGWRYIYEDGTDEENAEVFEYCKQKWNELYRFVTTSSSEDFKAHFSDYFVVDSALYYYLFTTRYCMVDNRSKNLFFHYGKTGEVDDNGDPVRKWDLSWDYDNDTALGLNNYGKQVYRYGLEDTDVDESGEEIFRESDSQFFCKVRDNFKIELRTLYNTLESRNAWHAESFINQADSWQSEFPEELWRLDINRKYIRSYNESFIDGAGDTQFLVNMCNGKMKYHRRQWERSQEMYMASKYQSSVAANDNAVIRCAKLNGNLVIEPNYRLKLTPYDYMYLNVQYGTATPIQVRVKKLGEAIEIPFDKDSTDIISIYSCSNIKSFGDLSTCYAATVDTSKASRITELIIGNETEGYDNPYFTTLTLGANYLLQVLNVENVSGLTQTLNMSTLHNLREVYAHGSNTLGVTFAPGGKIEVAELPAINAITMKNLIHLRDLDIASFNNLTKLVVENCNSVDVATIVDSAPNLNRARITGVDWILDDTSLLNRLYSLSGVTNTGANSDHSVLSGSVHVLEIREREYDQYKERWPDLEITYTSMIAQHAVTFYNGDGSILEVQYVDFNSAAVDPTTRAENPLIPVKESTVEHEFTFKTWNRTFDIVLEDLYVTPVFTESIRQYTIKYLNKDGKPLQIEENCDYGSYHPYTGAIPTYTTFEDGSLIFYLFSGWDNSGFVDGEKTVNAVYDEFSYTNSAFEGKKFKDMTPVELYALIRLKQRGILEIQPKDENLEIIDDKCIISVGDEYSFTLGNDLGFPGDGSRLLVAETGGESSPLTFTGNSYYDTGVTLFDEDKDFVLAIDYEFTNGNTSDTVLAQCYDNNIATGESGFRLMFNSSSGTADLNWEDSSTTLTGVGKREMLVIRHKKGSDTLTIYNSNLDGAEVTTVSLDNTPSITNTESLIFGCYKYGNYYRNHAHGNIYWCKLWYMDLGDEVCKQLAAWPHEEITMQACMFENYEYADGTKVLGDINLIAKNLLDRPMLWNNTAGNAGGWAGSDLNETLNTRLYSAFPTQIRSLLKQVVVKSTAGGGKNNSTIVTNVTSSNCYIWIPSAIEIASDVSTYIGNGYKNEIDDTTQVISIIPESGAIADSRICTNLDGTVNKYWLRSPNIAYPYVLTVDEKGSVYGFIESNRTGYGIRIMVTF